MCKRLLTVTLSIFSVLIFNIALAGGPEVPLPPKRISTVQEPGWYAGIQGGYSIPGYTNQFLTPGFGAINIHSHGLGIRLFTGYDFNKYFGTEFNVIYFKKPLFTGIPGVGNIRVKHNVIALLFKIMLPVANSVSIYAAGGGGYIARSGIYSGTLQVLRAGNFAIPVYGLGLVYNFYKGWNFTASWIEAGKRTRRQLPASDYFGIIGIFYKL